MRFKYVRQWIGVALLLALVVAGGCKGGNIFGLRDASDSDAGDLIRTGEEQIRDGKFNEAVATFAQAVALDSLNSQARFLHAKAVLLASDLSIVELLRDITSDALVSGNSLPLFSPPPGVSRSVDDPVKDNIYRTNITITEDLRPIARGLTRGLFDSASVALDLSIAEMIRGILRLRDTNNDLRINSSDFFFSVSRGSGSDFDFTDLNSAIGTGEDVRNFNQLIQDLASGNNSIVQQVLDNLRRSGLLADDTSINIDELERVITELGDSALFYLIFNAGDPDPAAQGDNDNDGSTNEELLNGVDDDGDGLVDEDALFQ